MNVRMNRPGKVMKMINELLLIVLTSALINNIVLSQFLGLCPFMGTSEKIKNAAAMGAAVIYVISLTSAVTAVLYHYVLLPLNITYLQTFLFILIILLVVKLSELAVKRFFKRIYGAVGVYLPVLMTNCVVLGAVLINTRVSDSVLTGVVNGFAAAVGFTLVIIILAGIREKICYNNIPESFKGLPITMLITGLMAMAFFGFSMLL